MGGESASLIPTNACCIGSQNLQQAKSCQINQTGFSMG